ncbi:MAG TPA: GntR family transcriptional regulator [Alphaproteobacteria bacterium]|nr:GntR family transcriptional regulator [Alphaproteobacteria bacterium]
MAQTEAGKSTVSLRDRVVARVRSDIVSGRSGPGTIYSAPSLASELGVSTTPVREALLELSNRGMIVPMRNRGFKVQASSLEDLENLFEARQLLERFAVVKVAKRGLADPGQLTELADAVAAAVTAQDVRGYLEADRAFHAAFVSRAGNPRLTKMIIDLRDDMRLFGIDSAAGEERQRASVKEHYELVDLAVKGDTKAIASLITAHIMAWQPIFRKGLMAWTQHRPL